MALPSGTFSRSVSGALQVSFSGEWSASSFDFGSGHSDIVLACTVSDGTTTRTVYLSQGSPSAFVDWDYVAGTTLTCAMAVQSYTIRGAGTVHATKLRIRHTFMKR